MSEYLNILKQFAVHADNSVDTFLLAGQKVQMNSSVDAFVRRPDRLRANIDGDQFYQEFYYDGKSVTLFGKKANYYASAEAPPIIEEALYHAEQSVGLVVPMADLLSRNSYNVLMDDVYSGIYVGLSKVRGTECHHLAFRGEETDWQVWVENSDTPFPRKFVITSKWVTGAPQFVGLMNKWDISPQLKDDLLPLCRRKGPKRSISFPLWISGTTNGFK